MVEVWKDVVGYEGYYEVSNLGNIRSLDRDTTMEFRGSKRTNPFKGKVLKFGITTTGYYQVNLYCNGKGTWKRVHRIVAEAFIENLNGKECVNHIDENKLNNNVENLEWVTVRENCLHGTKPQKQRISASIPVVAYDLDDNIIKTFDSAKDASVYFGGSEKSRGNISKAIKGKVKTAFGYKWKYVQPQN